MLEILLIWHFCKKIGEMLRRKGRAPIWFQVLFVGCWFGGEFLGGIFGALITGGTGASMYLVALACAIAGAAAAYVIASSATPAPNLRNGPTGGFPVIPTAQVPQKQSLS